MQSVPAVAALGWRTSGAASLGGGGASILGGGGASCLGAASSLSGSGSCGEGAFRDFSRCSMVAPLSSWSCSVRRASLEKSAPSGWPAFSQRMYA